MAVGYTIRVWRFETTLYGKQDPAAMSSLQKKETLLIVDDS